MDDFIPASQSSSKARRLQQKKDSSKPSTSSNSKGGKKGKPSTFLSTQPTAAVPSKSAQNEDAEMSEWERLPMDHRTEEQKASAKAGRAAGSAAVTSEQASAAMEVDGADDDDEEDDALLVDPASLSLPTPVTRTPISQIQGSDSLSFPAVSHVSTSGLTQRRKVGIPPHRMTPLKRDWIKIYGPLVEECGLQVRMNMHKRWVEMKVGLAPASASSSAQADPCSSLFPFCECPTLGLYPVAFCLRNFRRPPSTPLPLLPSLGPPISSPLTL